MSRKIGEFLVGIGALTPDQVEEIRRAQKEGDPRLFGQIAVARGYIPDGAIRRYLEYLEKAEKHQAGKECTDL